MIVLAGHDALALVEVEALLVEDEARFEELFSLPSSFFFSFAEFLSLSLWLTLVFLDLCSNRPRSLSSRPLFSAQRWLLLLLTLSSSPLSLSLPFPSLSLSLSLSLLFGLSLSPLPLPPPALPPSLPSANASPQWKRRG